MNWICFNGVWTDGAGNLMKIAPLQLNPHDRQIPWPVAVEAYKEYAAQHGTTQSLERLCERGGFSATELAILLYERIKRIEQPRMETVPAPEESFVKTFQRSPRRVKDVSIYEHNPALETLPQIKARDAKDYPEHYTNPWAKCAMEDRHWLLAEIERLQAREREAFRLANAATYLVAPKYSLHAELKAFMDGQISKPEDYSGHEPPAAPLSFDFEAGCMIGHEAIGYNGRECPLCRAAQPPLSLPAEHREGTEPLSRVIGDLDYCLTQVDPAHPVGAALVRIGVALRNLNKRSALTKGVPRGPTSVYLDHLNNRASPMDGCDCTACEDRRA